MERALRLIVASPVDQLAHTLEALLVVASQPLTVDELTAAADDDRDRVETALGLLSERYREGRSGIVLERVAGGYAFRASRDAAEACARPSNAPPNGRCRRRPSRRLRSSRTSARARAPRSHACAASRSTRPWPGSSSGA